MRLKRKLIPYLLFLIIFILIPVILTLLISFTKFDFKTIIFDFSFNNYKNLNEVANFWHIIIYSIIVSLIASFICVLIAVPFCCYLNNFKSQILKNQLLLLATLPMWLNALMRLIGLKTFFDSVFSPSFTQSTIGLIIGSVYIFLPLMLIPIYSIVSKIDKNLIEASEDLGANKSKTFLKVTLPLMLPGIFSGLSMTFLAMSTSVTIPQFIGANHIMIGQNIYNSVNQGLITMPITMTVVTSVIIFSCYGLITIIINLLINRSFKVGQHA